jgi:hypothetical protein
MANPQNFIDRMLEVENLTDALEDEDADYVLNWGIEQLREKLGMIEDYDAAGEFTNNLMGFMRKLNNIAGDLENIQPEDLAQLAERRQIVFGAGFEFSEDDYGMAAERLKLMTPSQAIKYLLQASLKEE